MTKVRNIETGEVQDVTQDQLGVTLASGNYEPEKGARVPVVDQFGDIVEIDAENVISGAAEQSGMRIATPQEVAEQRKQQEYGEGLGTLQAGAEGVARGASVGLSDVLLRNLGVSAEGLRERKKRNPVVSGVGEAAGVVGSVLLSGGIGGVEQAAGRGALATAARMTPAGLIARGGMAAEREIAAIVGEGVARKALGMAAVGAGEGALYGAGEAVSEAALGDHELTAERVLASAGHGAIWGAGTTGAMSLIGSGAGAVAKKLKKVRVQDDAELAGAFGLPAKNVDLAIEGKITNARKVVDDLNITQESKGLVKRYLDKANEVVRGRRALRSLDDTLDAQTEAVTRNVTRLEEIVDDVMYNDLTISSKIKTMARVVREDKNVDVQKLANHIEDSMQTTMEKYNEVVYDKSGFGYDPYEVSTVKRVKKPFEMQLQRAKELVRKGDINDNIEELIGLWDQSKRDLGKIDDALEGNGFGNRVMAREFKDYYMTTLRNDMMDETILGDAAKIQQAWNRAFTEDIDVKRAYNRFFLTDAGGKKKSGGFGNVKVGDLTKIRGAIRSSNQELNLYNSIMRRSAKSKAELLETLSTFSDTVDQRTLKMVAESRELSDNILNAMDISSKAVTDSNLYKRALEEVSDVPMAAQIVKTLATVADRGSQTLKGMGDKLFEGKITGWINTAKGAEANKKNILKGINQRSSSVANASKKAVDAFFKRGKRAVAPLVVTQYDPKESVNDRYNRVIERHNAIFGNQGLIAEKAGQMLDSNIAPNTSVALTNRALKAAQFLQSKQPSPNIRPSDVFARLDKRQRVADSEIAKYMRYVDGVEHPVESIKRFGESGDMPRETAEAIREVYPKLFADFETKITEKLVDAKEPLPYGDLMRLSLILNRPLHPSLEGSYIAMCQSAHQQKSNDKVAPSRRSMPDTSEHYLSPSQRLG